MALPKGRTNNKNGRPPGKPNKVTAELRERIKSFLDSNFEEVTESWKELDPEKKLAFYEKLISYVVPKLKAVELSTGADTDIIVIPPNFSAEDRKTRIEELKTKLFEDEK